MDSPSELLPVPREMHGEELELHDAELHTRIVVRGAHRAWTERM